MNTEKKRLTEEEQKQAVRKFEECTEKMLSSMMPELAGKESMKSMVRLMKLNFSSICDTTGILRISFDDLMGAVLIDQLEQAFGSFKKQAHGAPSVPPSTHAKDLGATSFPRSTNPGLN